MAVLLKCLHCGYEWEPRRQGKKPKQCPACKSPRWDREPYAQHDTTRGKSAHGISPPMKAESVA